MEQVLENLLVNALRYVPSGGSIEIALGPASGGGFRLAVSDDGPGIAAKDLPRVFERFYRSDEARASGGSGLGLAIVRQIVIQHGGSVHATPRTPRGTAFVVDLPAA
jgi:two-component system sensor histidine kinase BaeS